MSPHAKPLAPSDLWQRSAREGERARVQNAPRLCQRYCNGLVTGGVPTARCPHCDHCEALIQIFSSTLGG
jgi:hypothetical protein